MAFWDKFIKTNQKPAPQPDPQPQKEVATLDTVITCIDDCKATLRETKLSPDEINAYVDALSVMQHALRGLHAGTDITDLLDMLTLVFSTSMGLTFNFGTKSDCDEALGTITDAIKTIPSTKNNDVLIAALKLSILSQNALIYHQNQIIQRYIQEVENFRREQRTLLTGSGARTAAELNPFDANTFSQIDQKLQMRQGRIDAARLLISAYNQEIVSLESSIESILINPRSFQSTETKERISNLRKKAPGGSELAVMIEEAAKDAAVIAAENEAEIKLIRETTEENLPTLSLETQKHMEAMLEEIHAPKVEQTEEAQATQEQTDEQSETLTL